MYFFIYIMIIFIIMFICLILFLQYHLSKKKNKFLGLIIPFISILYIVLLFVLLIPGKETYTVSVEGVGEYIFNNEKDAHNKFLSLIEDNYNVAVNTNRNSEYIDNKTLIFEIIPIIIITTISIAIYIIIKRSDKI